MVVLACICFALALCFYVVSVVVLDLFVIWFVCESLLLLVFVVEWLYDLICALFSAGSVCFFFL